MNNPFESKIEELKDGTLEKIVVDPNEFPAFREIWKNLPDRMNIVGEAGLNGRITYRYVKEST